MTSALIIFLALLLPFCPGRAGHTYIQGPKGAERGRSADTYLALVLRVHEDGSICLVRANEISGKLVSRTQSSALMYAVKKGRKLISTGFLPDDPLIERGFRAGAKGEKLSQSGVATLLVSVPNATMRDAEAGKLSVWFYVIKPEVHVAVEDAEQLDHLVSQSKATVRFKLLGREFASQLKRLNRRQNQ